MSVDPDYTYELILFDNSDCCTETLDYIEPEVTTCTPVTGTNFTRIISMDKEQLARFLDKNTKDDGTPWSKWFDKNYCKNCESIEIDRDTAIKELGIHSFYGPVQCAYCELHHKCKFFPDMDDIPDSYDTILMWLEEEVDAGKE